MPVSEYPVPMAAKLWVLMEYSNWGCDIRRISREGGESFLEKSSRKNWNPTSQAIIDPGRVAGRQARGADVGRAETTEGPNRSAE